MNSPQNVRNFWMLESRQNWTDGQTGRKKPQVDTQAGVPRKYCGVSCRPAQWSESHACLSDMAGGVRGHRHKVSITIKLVIIFVLAESLTFHFFKKQNKNKKCTPVKCNKAKYNNTTRCADTCKNPSVKKRRGRERVDCYGNSLGCAVSAGINQYQLEGGLQHRSLRPTPEFLIPGIWSEAWGFAFLISLQVILMLLVQGP